MLEGSSNGRRHLGRRKSGSGQEGTASAEVSHADGERELVEHDEPGVGHDDAAVRQLEATRSRESIGDPSGAHSTSTTGGEAGNGWERLQRAHGSRDTGDGETSHPWSNPNEQQRRADESNMTPSIEKIFSAEWKKMVGKKKKMRSQREINFKRYAQVPPSPNPLHLTTTPGACPARETCRTIMFMHHNNSAWCT